MIELRSVRKVYVDSEGREQEALRGVDLKVESGEVHALIGTSGCGKTTTLRLVNRLEEPTSGQVLVDGADIRSEDPIALRRRIGYVIQTGVDPNRFNSSLSRAYGAIAFPAVSTSP